MKTVSTYPVERVSTDHQLLRAYVETRDDSAFAELVHRHAGIVYASALRQTCDPNKAEDVVQAVFLLLSRKASSLSESVPLGAWLFRAAAFAAKDLMKAERRRVQRDQIAYSMNPIDKTPPQGEGDDDLWQRISPVLDECLSRMPELDRRAILLRFFEEKSLAEVGHAMGIAEDAARKRVSRAVTRLRELLSRRGAEIGETDLLPVLSTRAAAIAPVGLAAATAAAVLGSAPKASAAALSASVGRQLAWNQWRWWIAAAGSAAVVGGTTAHFVSQSREPAAVVRPAVQTDDYTVAGFPDAHRVHEFIQELQARTSLRDAAGVARLLEFPLRVNRGAEVVLVRDAAEFTGAFDQLFPQSVAGMVLKCPRSRLFANSQGVMIGTGEVWIAPRGESGGKPVPRVIAINIE